MEETFAVFHRVLSFAGISIFARNNWNSKLWLAFQIFNFIIGALCFIFTTGFVVVSYSDLLVFIKGACIWTTGVIMSISLGVCLVFRKKFREFLDEMGFKDTMTDVPLIKHVLKLEGGCKLMELKKMVHDSQEKLLKFTRLLLKSYVAIVWLVATMYLCTPIYEMAVADDAPRLLPFDMWFPWGFENFSVYAASFIFNAYAGYLCCIAYPGLQSTIILLVGQNIRQLKILRFILQNLDELVSEITHEKGGTWQIYSTAILSQCMDHFVKIKRFSNRLNVICRPFYLALIFVSIMLVCMCSVKIAVSDKLSPDTIKYYIHAFCFILIVLMFCLLGQQIDNESEQLEKAVTEKWYIFDKKHKTSVRILQLALSQGMPIYIFGTIPLSLPTFTWFIKTGMSFFTMVMTVIED